MNRDRKKLIIIQESPRMFLIVNLTTDLMREALKVIASLLLLNSTLSLLYELP